MGNRNGIFYSKKINVVILLSALVFLLIAFWYGGIKKWELTGLKPETASSSSLSVAYEEKLKEDPEDLTLKYNLAYFYYRQKRFDEAEVLLSEILSSSHTDAELIKNVSFNLGNSLYRLSEKTEDSLQAIELLKKSLDQYRAVVEYDKERQRYASLDAEIDQDAKHNYAVVKNRIKILADQQAQQNETQQRKKEVFVLLKELLAEEKQIKTQLESLQSVKLSSQSREQRDILLKRRMQNLELLRVLKERIRQVIHSQKQHSSPSPVI
jgi:tetratricopeptide (TPR) repeat protein